MPVIMDHKLFGQTGDQPGPEIPEADVGIISGGIRVEENKEIAEEMRRKCNTLIALGSCACFGGLPALANQFMVDEIHEKVWRGCVSTDPAETPTQEVSPFTDRIYALHEVVNVDLKLPGCPTTPDMVAEALTALLEGREISLPTKSVCDECPTIREKKAMANVKRPLESVEFEVGKPLDTVRCYMEQGFLCNGPATRSGCGGAEKTPRCIKAYMPCRGCFGPLSDTANPLVDMMGALSTIGLDVKQIQDRAATFNRFSGAGRLRPLPKRS
jgi:F420-non-reducing hydrogenase small subunit